MKKNAMKFFGLALALVLVVGVVVPFVMDATTGSVKERQIIEGMSFSLSPAGEVTEQRYVVARVSETVETLGRSDVITVTTGTQLQLSMNQQIVYDTFGNAMFDLELVVGSSGPTTWSLEPGANTLNITGGPRGNNSMGGINSRNRLDGARTATIFGHGAEGTFAMNELAVWTINLNWPGVYILDARTLFTRDQYPARSSRTFVILHVVPSSPEQPVVQTTTTPPPPIPAATQPATTPASTQPPAQPSHPATPPRILPPLPIVQSPVTAPPVVSPVSPTVEQPAPASPQITGYTGRVIAPVALNVRRGPGMSYDVFAWLRNGDEVSIIGSQGNWVQVETNRGTGWVLGRYLSI